MGEIGIGSIAGMCAFAGPVPDAANISWTDAKGAPCRAHVRITPLPPPTRTSYMGSDRQIYIVIYGDGAAVVCYHNPGLQD